MGAQRLGRTKGAERRRPMSRAVHFVATTFQSNNAVRHSKACTRSRINTPACSLQWDVAASDAQMRLEWLLCWSICVSRVVLLCAPPCEMCQHTAICEGVQQALAPQLLSDL